MLAAACRRLLLHAICATVRETNALSISNHHFSARLCKAVPSLFSAPRLSRLCPGTIFESMLGLSSAFFGHSKTDIQVMLMLRSSFSATLHFLSILPQHCPTFSGRASRAKARGQQCAGVVRREPQVAALYSCNTKRQGWALAT